MRLLEMDHGKWSVQTSVANIHLKLLKICPPFSGHYSEAKVGRGCLIEHSIILVHAPPWFLAMLLVRLIINDNCSDLLEKWLASSLNMYHEKSAA